MRLDPYRLLVLAAVAEAGSVTAAAGRLHLAPSGVSQHLAALERETGLALVDRSRRGGQRPAVLTSDGRRLAAQAARLRALLDEVEADVLSRADQLHGPVTLAVFPTSLRRLALPAQARLSVAYESVRVRIVELDNGPALAALHAGEVDVALLEADAAARVEHRGIDVERLLEDRYRVAIPAGWARPRTIVDLAHQPWIEGPPQSATSDVLRRHRTSTGLPFPARHFCVEYPAVLDLVDAGLGAALVPDLALDNHAPRQASVVELPGLGGRAIYAACRRRRARPPLERALIEALHAAAAG